MPTATTLSPSRARRAIDGSGSRSGGATGSSVSGSSTEKVEGSRPAGRVAVLRHELAAVEDDEGVVRPRDREAVGGEHLEVRAEPVRPAAEDHVEVAVGVGGDARPASSGRAGRRGVEAVDLQRLGIEPLDPALDRRRLARRRAACRGAARRARPGRGGRACRWRRRRATAATSSRSPGAIPRPGMPRRAAPATRAAVLAGPRLWPVGPGHDQPQSRRAPARGRTRSR